jgi:hypothetical protein
MGGRDPSESVVAIVGIAQFDADGRNAARKWRIEINNWRPITVPLNEFASARLGAAVASLWEALAILTSASSRSCQKIL